MSGDSGVAIVQHPTFDSPANHSEHQCNKFGETYALDALYPLSLENESSWEHRSASPLYNCDKLLLLVLKSSVCADIPLPSTNTTVSQDSIHLDLEDDSRLQHGMDTLQSAPSFAGHFGDRLKGL